MRKVGSTVRSWLVVMAMLATIPPGAWATAGDPDYSFGKKGVANLPVVADGYDYLQRVVMQPDGRIVAAGRIYSKKRGADLGVVRLRPDGSRDRSFDGPSGHGNGIGARGQRRFERAIAGAVAADGRHGDAATHVDDRNDLHCVLRSFLSPRPVGQSGSVLPTGKPISASLQALQM